MTRARPPRRDPHPRSLEPRRDPHPRSLERLADKYRTLGELRRARARGEPLPPRSVFKALADEFPGALSELDLLPLDEIDRRERALADAAAGGPVEPWMRWLSGYHALMRVALRIKLRLRGAREIGGEIARALAADASAIAGEEVDEELVRAVATPPGGRIHRAILARLAREAGEDPDAIADALFPRRRGLRARSPRA